LAVFWHGRVTNRLNSPPAPQLLDKRREKKKLTSACVRKGGAHPSPAPSLPSPPLEVLELGGKQVVERKPCSLYLFNPFFVDLGQERERGRGKCEHKKERGKKPYIRREERRR